MGSSIVHRLIMNCPIYYQMILKDMYSPKQSTVDVIAYCTHQQGDMFHCTFGVDQPEVTIYEYHIKQAYARTGPIYRLLYL